MNRWLPRLFRREDGDHEGLNIAVQRFRPSSDTFLRNAVADWDVADREPFESDDDGFTATRLSAPRTGDRSDSERDESASTTDPRPGLELAGFRLRAVLGRGAEGTVYLATQNDLADRPVVLKVSSLHGGEHRLLARLQHTHIVPILSAQEVPDRGMRVICLPYLGGTTLERVLDDLASRPLGERSGATILEALDSAANPVRRRRRPRGRRGTSLPRSPTSGRSPGSGCAWPRRSTTRISGT
jgi:hypothetical protein